MVCAPVTSLMAFLESSLARQRAVNPGVVISPSAVCGDRCAGVTFGGRAALANFPRFPPDRAALLDARYREALQFRHESWHPARRGVLCQTGQGSAGPPRHGPR